RRRPGGKLYASLPDKRRRVFHVLVRTDSGFCRQDVLLLPGVCGAGSGIALDRLESLRQQRGNRASLRGTQSCEWHLVLQSVLPRAVTLAWREGRPGYSRGKNR